MQELAELHCMIVPNLAEESLRQNAGKLSPDEVRRLSLLAHNSETVANSDWRRAVDQEMARHKPSAE